MTSTRFVGWNLAFATGMLAPQMAHAQSGQTRASVPAQANFSQVSPVATGPASSNAPVPAPSTQPAAAAQVPAAGMPAPQAAAPTVTTLPGQPYLVVDPATGRAMPIITYGPMARPRPEVLPYVEGAPGPRGYVLEEYHPRGLLIGGAVTLGVLYMISFTVASANNFGPANGWLAVPVIGPFGWLATRKSPNCNNSIDVTCNSDESGNRTVVALDGMGQAAGAAMLVAGLAITRKHWLLVDPQDVFVAPYTSSTGSGLNIFGRF